MALAHSPKIVTNGLVLCLDAANPKSYPGTGTTCFDLSGNNNHGTLVNGTTYSDTNNGRFIFDGSNDYITVSLNLQNTNYSVMAIARYTGTGQNRRVISSNSGNWLMGWWAGQTNKYFAEGWVSPETGGTAETSWICYVATGSQPSDSWALYRNGALIVGPNANGSNGPNGIRIGGSGVYGEYSACEVNYVSAYNRVLTATEIQQNFNAFRGRFGL